jgi:CelD/BcsL family acetyltransferase involved in cellulose biosynthesis
MPSTAARSAEVEPLTSMDAERELWTELAAASSNIFSSWEWANVWWRHFGGDRKLVLRRVRSSDGTASALLPLVEERHASLRVARIVGHGVADELGPVCAPSDRAMAVEALNAASADRDVLLVERLPMYWANRPLPGRLINEEASPVISLEQEGDWDQYLAARSKNFRQQVRRRARRLERGLAISYRLADDPDRLDADFDVLLALHRANWGSRSNAFAGAREAFHRDFAASALARGWLRLWLAESHGQPVAAWYGFRFGAVESFYQAGRDPRWDRFAVGAGVLEHSIREAFHDGMREYRLLRGHERYKSRYATATDMLLTVAVPGSALGRATVAAAEMLARSSWGRQMLVSLAS